jgi:beta-galactosidase
MILAAQYYRPPFPDRKFWNEDLDAMKAAGLNTVQLWALWSWVEAHPGIFDFSDYDELVEAAGKRGLKVVLSTCAELHPSWIHRVVPDSAMIDHRGNRVISTNRGETHQGLTPGGCTDNPAVRERMRAFLDAVAARYAGCEHLAGWDCWNELRWNMQADALVCFCPHTLAAFREWLAGKYGDLDGLNRAWKRRYDSWDDVWPGKLPARPYTEMMEFEAFLQWRIARHMRFRVETIRKHDARHLISAHGSQPSFMMAGDADNHAMNRGNDFDLAPVLDGLGCSHFPFWSKIRDEDFGVRLEATRSAAAGKVLWVSELQGGSARQGFSVYPSVSARPQQRWVWNGYARGAKAVIFWCWRDEEFGRESSGYGIAGLDGLAPERLKALSTTAAIVRAHNSLLEAYRPDPAAAGVWFDANAYNLEWAQDGTALRARAGLKGWMTAFERISVAYDLVDGGHLDSLDRLRLLVMPFSLVVPEQAARRIAAWVRKGGTLIAEAELDAFTTIGLYRTSGPGRWLAHELGMGDLGRRPAHADALALRFGGKSFRIRLPVPRVAQVMLGSVVRETSEYITPLRAGTASQVLARDPGGDILALSDTVGAGTVISIGGFVGRSYDDNPYPDFERLLRAVVTKAGALPGLRVESKGLLQWRTGMSDGTRILFVINSNGPKKVKVRGPGSLFGPALFAECLKDGATRAISGRMERGFDFTIEEGGWTAWRWGPA